MAHVSPPPVYVVRPQQSGNGRYVMLALFWLGSLLIAAGAERWYSLRTATRSDGAAQQATQQHTDDLQQRITVLERSEQVARAANLELQQTLRDRQEEISALRADLAFYSRLTGSGARREGLSVQSLHLVPGTNPRVYNFTVVLTQTLKNGQLVGGHLHASVNGVVAGKLTTLNWNEIASNQDAAGIAFSFKYFQQLNGSIMLPEGFIPNRIRIDAEASADIGHAGREFAWSEALNNPEVSDVTQ